MPKTGTRHDEQFPARPVSEPVMDVHFGVKSESSKHYLGTEGEAYFNWQQMSGDGPGSDRRRRAFSIRFLGDDAVHAPRAWKTSPEFPGLADELPSGAPMDHELFPVLWP